MQGCPGHNTIAAFVDGGLDANDVESLEQHIDSCDDCRRHISSLVDGPPSQSFVFDSPDVAGLGDAPPEADTVSLLPGARVGRFVVLRIIARGGMGAVARAYDPELDRRVALKLLRPELWRSAGADLRAQLRREAVVMARLAHPNVVTVFDVGTCGEQVFIAMEYVAGATLREWLADDRPWRDRLAACLAAAQGLAAAHRAGVVHRDVKPANILCGDDGRVLVGDFGLAVLEDADAGLVAGTPGYMAPEQMAGRPADERSDQFAFCVTAWEALTGQRPFAGGDLAEIYAAIRRGPPRIGRGPQARVLAVLARGLAEATDDRHATMESLVAALERAAAPRTRARWIAGGAGLAAAGLAAGLFFWPERGPRCGDGESRLAGVWNRSRRAKVAAQFPGADRFAARIDLQGRGWVAAYTDACRATHERGEQSEVMLDQRMSCLGGQLRELDALLDAVASGGGGSAIQRSAIEAAHALPRVDRCSAEAIAGRGRPAVYPDDRAAQAHADEIDRLLDEASARHRLAQLDREKALLDRAVKAAAALGDPVRHARALLAFGTVQLLMNELPEARKSLERAALVAAEGHDDETAAGAAAEMLSLVSQANLNGSEVALWEQTLERELARSPDPELRAQLELQRGIMAHDRGDRDGALAHAEKALAMAERALGADNPRIARALRFVGGIRTVRGDHAGAEKAIQRALDLVEASYGPDHPDVAAALSLLARAVADGGDPAKAVELLRRSLAIREKVFGPDHPDVAQSLGNLATALEMTGDLAGARRAYERSLAIEEKALGTESWESAPGIASLAGIMAAQGDPAARATYERAVALYRDKFPPDFPDQTIPLAGLGHLLRRSGRCREAAPHLERALAIHRTHKTEPPAELAKDARACGVSRATATGAVSPDRRRSSR